MNYFSYMFQITALCYCWYFSNKLVDLALKNNRQISEVFLKVTSSLYFIPQIAVYVCLGALHKDIQPGALGGWNLVYILLTKPMNPVMGCTDWEEGRTFFFFLLKGTMSLPTIVSRGQIHPDNVWFLLLPPRNGAFFWITQVWHSDHGYHRLLQWLRSVHGQGERKKPHRKAEKSKKSSYLILDSEIIFEIQIHEHGNIALRGKALIIRI